MSSTALAHPNIAFIKYWGNQDDTLRVPMNSSLSMNLAALSTTTSVEFLPGLRQDELFIDDQPANQKALQRATAFLDILRARMPQKHLKARVVSHNDFPMGAGIASSASAFAALAAAASQAAGLGLNEMQLSRLARRGSGSACRSIPSGFVQWHAGTSDEDSYAFSIAPPNHWQLVDLIAIVSQEHKSIGSSQGHTLAASSPLQAARVADCPRRLEICRTAILKRDFATFAQIVELDSNLMHAVMLSSSPSLLYWEPTTISILKKVQAWRADGLPACCTVDAGPNLHVLCPVENADELEKMLQGITGIENILRSEPGSGVNIL